MKILPLLLLLFLFAHCPAPKRGAMSPNKERYYTNVLYCQILVFGATSAEKVEYILENGLAIECLEHVLDTCDETIQDAVLDGGKLTLYTTKGVFMVDGWGE